MYKDILNQRNDFVSEIMSEEPGLLEGLDQVKIGSTYVEYFEPGWDGFMHRVNLFELGYKAKQWAFKSGYVIKNDLAIKMETKKVLFELTEEEIAEVKAGNPLIDIKICLMIYDCINIENAQRAAR